MKSRFSFFKKIALGLVALGVMGSSLPSYGVTAVEYAIMIAFTPTSSTQSRLSSGFRINSVKDDATGEMKYYFTVTNPPVPSNAQNIDVVIRYTNPDDRKEYVVQTGFLELCRYEDMNDNITLVCPLGNSGGFSTSTSTTTDTSTTLTR